MPQLGSVLPHAGHRYCGLSQVPLQYLSLAISIREVQTTHADGSSCSITVTSIATVQ
jgi:hypothetical protein